MYSVVKASRAILPAELPGKPPRPDTHDEHARALVQGGVEEDKGSGGLPQRDERSDFSDGDSLEEQRRVGTEALPHDGHPRRSREIEPTTFETLTILALPALLRPVFESSQRDTESFNDLPSWNTALGHS
jgi:hypothetical protein